MARPDVTLEQIRIVTSHPMALKQCVGTLARLGLDSIPAANTAMAAKALIEDRRRRDRGDRLGSGRRSSTA